MPVQKDQQARKGATKLAGIFDPDRHSQEKVGLLFIQRGQGGDQFWYPSDPSACLGTLLSVLDSRWAGTAVMNGEGLGDQGPDPLEMSLGHPTRSTI